MILVLSFKQAPVATLDLLVERPEFAVVFWMDPDYKPTPTPGWVRWLARMLGGYTPPMELPEAPPELDRTGIETTIDDAESLMTNTDEISIGTALRGSTHGHGDDLAVYPDQAEALGEAVRDERVAAFGQAAHAASLGVVLKLS